MNRILDENNVCFVAKLHFFKWWMQCFDRMDPCCPHDIKVSAQG